MKLRNLVQRTSLTNRSAGDFDVPQQQVFEVRDLIIPAGTDWSNDGYILGTVAHDGHAAVMYSLAIELEAAPADTFSFYGFGGIDMADPQKVAVSRGVNVADPADYKFAAHGWGDPPNYGLRQTHIAFYTFDGPTTAPIHVLRARASFLVL